MTQCNDMPTLIDAALLPLADKISTHAEALMRRGEIAELRVWCEITPIVMRRVQPELSMWLAWALVLGDTPEQADAQVRITEVYLAELQQAMPGDPLLAGRQPLTPHCLRGVQSQLNLIRAIAARRMGYFDLAQHWLDQATAQLWRNDQVLAGVIKAENAWLAQKRGALVDARRGMFAAALQGESTQHVLLQVSSLGRLAELSLQQGDAAQAQDLAMQAQHVAQMNHTVLFDFIAEDVRRLAQALPIDLLSEREREVLACLAQGWRDPQIARVLGVSVSTVRWHCRNVYRKLGVNSRGQAAAFCKTQLPPQF